MNSFPSSINTILSETAASCSFHNVPSSTKHFLSHTKSTDAPEGLFTASLIISTNVVLPVALSPWIIVIFLLISKSYFRRFVETITLCFPFIISRLFYTNSPAILTSSIFVCTIWFVFNINISNPSLPKSIK